MRRLMFVLSTLLLTTLQLTSGSFSSVQAQEYRVKPKQNPAFAEVVEDPSLPRVLIIGDSISIGYTPPLRELLHGKANVYRIPVNGGPSSRGVENIDRWLGDTKWDVIHFNFGLHDLVYMDENKKRMQPPAGGHQVPLEQYKKNLTLIVERLKKTDARLIWRNTTPVPANSPYRVEGEEKFYNEAAAEIMKKYGIPTDDHHTYVSQHLNEVQLPANVHFTPAGSRKLAELAALAILEELPAVNDGETK